MLVAVLSVAAIGLICGVILVIASKLMAVPVDEKAEKLRDTLPGANCGACGFAGCDGYAKYLADEKSPRTNLCAPGGDRVSRKISEILGMEFQDVVEKKAFVRCTGTFETAEYKMEYDGPQTCAANNMFYQGRRSCSVGCLGFGDCVSACKFDAMSIVNGVAVVDRDLCTGCSACAKVCPNNLIDMVKETNMVSVGCSSHQKGALVRKECTAGCIGCMKCQKTCEYDAIHVTNNLATIDYDKCTNCGKCVEVCPVHVIKNCGANGVCTGCSGN